MPYPQEAKTTLTPTKVEGISNARSLNNDMDYYVASTKDNHFYGWGTRSFAKEAEYDLTPVLWDKFNDSKLAYVKDMEATTSFASITNNGNVLMNGRADNNHLGQGDGGSSEGFVTDPVTVKGLSNITQLGLGNYHTVALTNGGSVYTWGKIKRGWADEQDTFNTGTPKKVSQLSNVVSVDANSCACAAVDKNGNLYMWGNPQDSMYFGSGIGLFGDGGSKDYVAEPKKVEGISNVKSIKMTDIFCAAITNDGTLYMWGNNSGGQLATGNKENKLVPTKVEGISNVSYVDLGKNHTIAVTDNGDVYTWGNNDSGQLGDGTNTEKLKPTKIESGLVAFD